VKKKKPLNKFKIELTKKQNQNSKSDGKINIKSKIKVKNPKLKKEIIKLN